RSVTSDAGDPESFDSGQRLAGVGDFSYTFPTPGTYPYHDSLGAAQTGIVVVYGAPTLALTPSANTILRGQAVTFQASADTNPSGGPLTYEWDLNGNGTYETTNSSSETVSFPSAGFFNVGIRVTDEAGDQVTGVATVQVNVPDSDGDGVNDDLDPCPAT